MKERTSSSGEWRLVLLGAPRFERADPPLVLPLSAKDAALAALVALDGPVAAERAAALLWPGVTPRQADNNLRQRLFRLRRVAGENLVATGPQLQLAPNVHTDLASTLAQVDADEHAG